MASRKSPAALGAFLFRRGVWLVCIEWFVISTAFTFAPGGIQQVGGLVVVPMQVIWAIGASMVVLAGAQFLGRRACLLLGATIILGHNLLDPLWPATRLFEAGAPLWAALHSQMAAAAGPFYFLFAYPLLPWIGVMLSGYGLAGVFQLPPVRRDLLLRRWGLTLTLAFLLIRALDGYGDPNHWQAQAGGAVSTTIDFLNTSKYPPSLLFLLMTLGPAAIFCSFADQMRGPLKDTLVMFGRVPFAFYVTHFFLIHALSVLLGVLQGFDATQFLTMMFFYPKGYGVGLPAVYLGWVLVMATLYPFCRWVAGIKSRRRDWWLSYL